MKVCFLITDLAMGGAENQVVAVADNLAKRGQKIILAYILQPALVVPQSKNIEIVWLGGYKSIWGITKAFIGFITLVKRTQPDVVHSHMFHANILARVSRIFTPIPRLVCTTHSNNDGGWLRMLLYRTTHKFSDVFTNVSHEAVAAFENKRAAPKNTMLVTHNGIDTHKFRFDPKARIQQRQKLNLSDSKVFIAIGRFHFAKDYPNLFHAFAHVIKQHTHCKLLVVGDGELRPEIEALLQQLAIQDYVQLLGIRYDVPALLSASDIFVLSSAWEGFGLVVAEAMATERITVATDCGGVAEVMGEKGFLVNPQNSQALADGMLKALSLNSKDAAQLGKEARQRIIKKYSIHAVVDKWEEIYQSEKKFVS